MERIMQLEKIYETQMLRLNDVVVNYEQSADPTIRMSPIDGEVYAFQQFLKGTANDSRVVICSYTQCKERALYGHIFCLPHILNDRKQKLFIPCVVCEAPVAKVLHSNLCTDHKPMPAILQQPNKKSE